MPVASAGATTRDTHTARGGRENTNQLLSLLFSPEDRGMQISLHYKGSGRRKNENSIKWKYLYNEQSKKARDQD